MKEATARVKINKLLETAAWRFFPDGKAPANICLELSVKIKESDLNALGENFENTERGFIDFLLLIHQNYISPKDIEICLAYDLAPLKTNPNYTAIEALHQSLRETYAESIAG